jgi:D-alanyl-D-alanine carboxypeptidase
MKRLLLLLICVVGVASAQESPAKYREYLDAAAKVDKFSGTVLVARKGQVLIEQAYGLADRKTNTPNADDTMYRIGSMSKPLTATAVMALRDSGKLKLGDSVCVYVAPCPETWKAVTLTHLLTHISGIPDVVKFPDYMEFRVKEHTPQQMVELIASRPVDFAPGAKFVYCNSNFILLGVVIQKASGMPYEKYLRRAVLDPAGMKHTGYEAKLPGTMAHGYVRDADGYRDPDPSAMSVRFSAGGLYSNVGDLMLFLRGLAAGEILKPSTVTEMWADRGNGYGYGWMPDDEKGRKSIGHNGRIDGYASAFRLYQDEDLFIAVLSNVNGTNTDRMTQSLAAIAHGEPFKMPHERSFISVPAATLAQYDGKYKLPWGLVLVVTHEGDQLFGRAEQEKKPTEWKAESATKFYVPPADIEIEFEKDASGKMVINFDGAAKAERQ